MAQARGIRAIPPSQRQQIAQVHKKRIGKPTPSSSRTGIVQRAGAQVARPQTIAARKPIQIASRRVGGGALPAPSIASARQSLAAPKPKRGLIGKIGGAFKSIGKGITRGAIAAGKGVGKAVKSKVGRFVIPAVAAFAIPGVGGVLAKGIGKFGSVVGKGISRGAIAAGKSIAKGIGGRAGLKAIGGEVLSAVEQRFLPPSAAEEIAAVDAAAQQAIAQGVAPYPGYEPGAAWHSTIGGMPPELRQVIADLDMFGNAAAVKFLAQLLGVGVGTGGNKLKIGGEQYKIVWHMGDADRSASWGWDQVIPGTSNTGTVEAETIGAAEEEVKAIENIPYEWVIWLWQAPETQPWLEAIGQQAFGRSFEQLSEDEQKVVVLALLMET